MLKLKDVKWDNTTTPTGVAATIGFGNEYKISIIQNDISYGGDKGLYEIAVLHKDEFTSLPGITNPNDTVAGYLTEDSVNKILLKMYTLTKRTPLQI